MNGWARGKVNPKTRPERRLRSQFHPAEDRTGQADPACPVCFENVVSSNANSLRGAPAPKFPYPSCMVGWWRRPASRHLRAGGGRRAASTSAAQEPKFPSPAPTVQRLWPTNALYSRRIALKLNAKRVVKPASHRNHTKKSQSKPFTKLRLALTRSRTMFALNRVSVLRNYSAVCFPESRRLNFTCP